MTLILALKAYEARTKPYRRTEMWLYLPKDARPPAGSAQQITSTVMREVYLTFALWTSIDRHRHVGSGAISFVHRPVRFAADLPQMLGAMRSRRIDDAQCGFLAHWYYHVPNLILAALIWLLVGRLILSLVVRRGGGRSGIRLLDAVTDPLVKAVGAVTPRLVPAGLVIVFAIAWLLAARIGLFFAVSATGVRLSMG